MKISKSKQELARIISENGGWRDGAEFSSQDKCGGVFHYTSKPTIRAGCVVWDLHGCMGCGEFAAETLPNWHQTILSREEYFHLHPAPDADGWIEFDGTERPSGYFNKMIDVKLKDGRVLTDSSGRFEWDTDGPSMIIAYRLHKPEQSKPEFCESVVRSIPELTVKPTIEQLAADYRKAKDCAERKQQEADAAKADAAVRLKALELAGEAISLIVSPINAKQEPELVITDWRDLQAGDLVWVEGEGGRVAEGEYAVLEVEAPGYDGKRTIRIRGGEGGKFWINYENGWRFIRRP